MFGKKKKKSAAKPQVGKKKQSKPAKLSAKKPVSKSSVTRKQQAPTQKARKALKTIAHDEQFELGVGLDKPIIINGKAARGSKRASRRVLKRAASLGGYTVFDGARAGKTFETRQEAAAYAADVLIRTGETVPVTKTQRQVTHTFRASENAGK